MKALLCTLLLAYWLAPVLEAHQDPPKRVRIQTQWVEMSHTQFTELFSGNTSTDTKLYKATHQLLTEKKAKIIHSSILLTRAGESSSLGSIQEIIYPTEYDLSSSLPPSPGKPPEVLPLWIPRVRPLGSCPPAFETRNTGTMLDVQSLTDKSGKMIDLRLVPKWVEMPKMVRWVNHKDQWGSADIKFPLFYKMESRSALTVANGEYSLVNVFNPMDKDGKADTAIKVLLFVKATIMPLELPH